MFSGRSDLPELPIVGREMLFLDHPLAGRVSRRANLDMCTKVRTSGTQGIPVIMYMSKSEALFRKLSLVRAWKQVDRLRFPLNVIDLGARLDPTGGLTCRWHGPVKLTRVPITNLDTKAAAKLQRFRQAILTGYPTSLTWFVESIGTEVSKLSIRMIATRGEILHGDTREALGRAFGCPVYDFYNCEEIGNIAWQCPNDKNKMHVNTDTCIVEVVDDSGSRLPKGEEGRILITNLYNCTMPLIRYDIQDRGRFLSDEGNRCSCGSRHPTIGRVEGRSDDFLMLGDGSRISPRLLAARFGLEVEKSRVRGYQGPLHRGYQIDQDAPDHLTVRVVAVEDIGISFESRVVEAFRQIAPSLRCSIVAVESLPLSSTGKLQKVVCSFKHL